MSKRVKRKNGVKTCKICERKPRAGKTTSYCETCNADYRRKYKQENIETITAWKRAYYAANRERQIGYAKGYKAAKENNKKEKRNVD